MPNRNARNPHRIWHAQARPYTELVTLWTLRLLITGHGLDAMRLNNGFMDDKVLQLALPHVDVNALDTSDHDALKARLDEQLAQAEQTGEEADSGPLFDNVDRLAEHLGLAPVEKWIITYHALQELVPTLEIVFGHAAEMIRLDPEGVLAIALDTDPRLVREALAGDAMLVRSGLLEPSENEQFDDTMSLLPGLARLLIGHIDHEHQLFQNYFEPTPPSGLTGADFSYMAEELAQLVELVRNAAEQGLRGINILLHGIPGVGKTELARLIGQLAELTSHEVRHETAQGKPLQARSRKRSYQLCQHLLARDRRALVVFDESEDCFPSNEFYLLFRESTGGGMAWFNRLLENNPVPAIWITNSPERLEPAYLRRFTYTLEMTTPPRSVRRDLWCSACEGLGVQDEWLDAAAELSSVTPAEIERTSRMARLLGDSLSGRGAERFIDEQLRRHGKLLGHRPKRKRRRRDPLPYKLEYLNATPAIEPIIESLVADGEGSLLLHGPPGTGKTALAHRIARAVDRPLLERPASEILDPYVGKTEQKLAALFEEARQDGAVLLLDEIDSLLSGREMAQRSWEITRTNELLVQLEAFEGIVICATNFLNVLDTAAMRRFDHKVELRALNVEARRELFREVVGKLDVQDSPNATKALRRLEAMEGLTLGDFTTIARRYRTRVESGQAMPTVATLAEELEQECVLKPEGLNRRVGFI